MGFVFPNHAPWLPCTALEKWATLKFVAYPVESDVSAFRKKSSTSQRHNTLTLTSEDLREKIKFMS